MHDHQPSSAVSLSVVIITYNEEANIGRCLRSLQELADDIVVVDSGSTDRTREICRAFGARCLVRPFPGYGAQKRYATAQARYDHVLSLDADEALTPRLRDAIRGAKAHWQGEGYAFRRLTNFCGQWIRHGEWYPDRIIRLFDRRCAAWQGQFHEHVVLDHPGSLHRLPGLLLHYSYRSVGHFLAKTECYSDWGAWTLRQAGKRAGFFALGIKPAYRFFRAWVLRLGFLDGYAGYCIARLTADRLFVQYAKLRELRRQGAEVRALPPLRRKALPPPRRLPRLAWTENRGI